MLNIRDFEKEAAKIGISFITGCKDKGIPKELVIGTFKIVRENLERMGYASQAALLFDKSISLLDDIYLETSK